MRKQLIGTVLNKGVSRIRLFKRCLVKKHHTLTEKDKDLLSAWLHMNMMAEIPLGDDNLIINSLCGLVGERNEKE